MPRNVQAIRFSGGAEIRPLQSNDKFAISGPAGRSCKYAISHKMLEEVAPHYLRADVPTSHYLSVTGNLWLRLTFAYFPYKPSSSLTFLEWIKPA